MQPEHLHCKKVARWYSYWPGTILRTSALSQLLSTLTKHWNHLESSCKKTLHSGCTLIKFIRISEARQWYQYFKIFPDDISVWSKLRIFIREAILYFCDLFFFLSHCSSLNFFGNFFFFYLPFLSLFWVPQCQWGQTCSSNWEGFG